MIVDFERLSGADVYRTMIQCVAPRPIAWALSDSGDSRWNVAPFSYFNGVASRPPLISMSVGRKRDGSVKDTWRNIAERSHFVLHIPSREHARRVSNTSSALPFGASEAERFDLATASVPGWPLPRIVGARIALWCERHQIIEVGEGPQGLILGRIVSAYVDDAIVGDGGAISASGLDPLARLGGDDYAGIGAPFTVPRPQ